MVRCFMLFLACSLSAQVAPKPNYRVVKADKPETTAAALNALAEQGYRLIVPGPMLILRLETTAPDTYRYMAVDSKGGVVQFLNWLNEQGARGYRWVQPAADVLEKGPHPGNYEYTSPGAHLYHFGQAEPDVISSLLIQGYEPVGFAWFSHYVGSSSREMFFEREIEMGPKPDRVIHMKEVYIVNALRADNVMKDVEALGRMGFKYLGPCPSQRGGGMEVMMQKCGQECGGPFEYHSFDVHDPAQMDKELSEQGKAGFRVVPQTLMRRPHLLERAAKASSYTYHVLPSKDLQALEQELNDKQQEGYEPIGYVAQTGVWTGAVLLVLEKVATVPAPAQSQPASK